ncbi:hypothetical protein RSO41_06125 [Halomonas sp. I1]|uniref:hypothetical protein n=1 Tax=Halomonas sp. I1 TaxID=393536 RepID=UPI0028DE9CF8|nr:hypothetical protein [Halomonas sp. I1]MDT8894227.1 hypothetical protein [Halomonas sp. I1]
MTNDQIQTLADIQRMALISVPGQTGQQTRHELNTFTDGGAWSAVGVYDSSNAPLYYSRVSIEADGTEMPKPGDPDSPCTLSEQHTQLAEWIAANRQKVAA